MWLVCLYNPDLWLVCLYDPDLWLVCLYDPDLVVGVLIEQNIRWWSEIPTWMISFWETVFG